MLIVFEMAGIFVRQLCLNGFVGKYDVDEMIRKESRGKKIKR